MQRLMRVCVSVLAGTLLTSTAAAETYEEPLRHKQTRPDEEPSYGPLMRPPESAERPSWRYTTSAIETYGMMLYGGGMLTSANELELTPGIGWDAPDVLTDGQLRLSGDGEMFGGGVRAFYASRDWGLRIGLGVSMYGVRGLHVLHNPLPDGVTISADDATAANFELSFGKAFDALYFYPYVDMKGSVNLIATQVETAVAGYGTTGTTHYTATSFGIAPRVGAFVPLTDFWFVDFSAQWGIVGLERGGGHVGMGAWSW